MNYLSFDGLASVGIGIYAFKEKWFNRFCHRFTYRNRIDLKDDDESYKGNRFQLSVNLALTLMTTTRTRFDTHKKSEEEKSCRNSGGMEIGKKLK